jgi:uncharacterized protein (TIGR02246 family)
MRFLVGVFFLMASISTAAADSKADALQIVDRWVKAFAASDVDAIVKLYAPDALFMGTGSKAVVTKSEGIRTYFEAGLLVNRPRGATLNSFESMVLSDGAVLVTGLDTLTGVKDGNPTSSSGRVTFVVAKRGADWQIVHFHRSAMPQ